MASLAGLIALPPARGADTGVFLAEAPEVASTTGLYWVKRRVKAPSKLATPQSAAQLWDESVAAVRHVLGKQAPWTGAMAAAC